jgi:two-component system sensor histidine kinase BaeS
MRKERLEQLTVRQAFGRPHHPSVTDDDKPVPVCGRSKKLFNKDSISIKYKLFFTILIGACALVLCLFLLVQWSFNRGFLNYANDLESERFSQLAEQIEAGYEKHGDWTFVRGNLRTWLKLLISSAPEPVSGEKYLQRIEREIRTGRFHAEEPFLPGMKDIFEHRVFLLDGRREPIFGQPAADIPAQEKEISYRGATVGYLGLTPGQNAYSARQIQFFNRQMLEFNIAAVLMILLAASCSLPLAHLIVQPVNSLAAALRALAMGRFETRAHHRSRDELGQFARDFNFMAMTLENNRKARQRFFADISHELRTPLAVLQAEIEAIQDGIHPPSRENLGKLHNEVSHLKNLVGDLSELSLTDIGAFGYRKRSFDLGELLKRKSSLYRPEFEKKNIRVDITDQATGSLKIFADPLRIEQLVVNLLENSLKYTDAGGVVGIDLERRKNDLTLHIRDSAPAVPEIDLEKLSECFYRADKARDRSVKGTGLGLAICQKIVAAHDGQMEFRLSDLGGLWIQVTLPLDG